jgi:hypothetical protein
MPDVQSFWSTIGSLAVVLAIIVGAVFWIRSRASVKPKPPAPPTPPVEKPKPAPSYHGVLLIKPVFDEGERFIFQTTRQVTGCLGETVVYGMDNNETGPYGVILRASRTDTGAFMPIYGHDGLPRCDSVCVPSGTFDIYLCAERPYSAIGSLIGCETFVPRQGSAVPFIPSQASAKACNPPQESAGGTPQTKPGKGQIAVLLEVTPVNDYGQMSGPYYQTILVQKKIC